jgi:DedD protein
MSDQRFREIQLTGKQLVFLFMASVVVAVSIFLLGVSVGRGVRGTTQASAEPATDQAGAIEVPARMPPETQPTPADLSYHTKLQGQTPPPQAPPRPAPAEAARSTAPPPAATDQGRASSAPTRAASPPSATSAPAAAGFFVQTDAFSSRGNADKRVAELKSKGHAAFVMTPGPPFRVRLGPLADRAEAERLAARLRAEGFTSSVTR